MNGNSAERLHSERSGFAENIFLKIPSERFHSERFHSERFQLGVQVFSEIFFLKDSILKDSFLKDSILKDFGFMEKSDSERFQSERFRAPHSVDQKTCQQLTNLQLGRKSFGTTFALAVTLSTKSFDSSYLIWLLSRYDKKIGLWTQYNYNFLLSPRDGTARPIFRKSLH
jgi:hypothetical protein